jgi:hypothetical protein
MAMYMVAVVVWRPRRGSWEVCDDTRIWYKSAGFLDIKETPPRAPLTSSLLTAKRPGGGLAEALARIATVIGENRPGLLANP